MMKKKEEEKKNISVMFGPLFIIVSCAVVKRICSNTVFKYKCYILLWVIPFDATYAPSVVEEELSSNTTVQKVKAIYFKVY